MISPSQDLGGHVKGAYGGCTNTAGAPIIVVAAGAGDAVANTGASIDRLGYDSCVVTYTSLAALANTKTLSLACEYQTSADNSTWATAVALQASAVVATGSGSGTNESAVTEFDLDLRPLPRYIRFNFTPDLSATGTDEAITTCSVQLGGATIVPAV